MLEVMEKVCAASPVAATFSEESDTDRAGVMAACITLTVCSGTPGTLLLMVMAAVRGVVAVLEEAVTVTVTASFDSETVPFEPEDDGETVNHGASLANVQLALEVTENVCCSPEAGKFSDSLDTDRVTGVSRSGTFTQVHKMFKISNRAIAFVTCVTFVRLYFKFLINLFFR